LTKDLTPIGQFGFFVCDFLICYGATMQGEWIRRPQGAASAVFVHGILSSGETCWRNDNGRLILGPKIKFDEFLDLEPVGHRNWAQNILPKFRFSR
jgi:hypothetical protein